jgi:two-component system cell cycle sensor histidine kinase/response regulator CckA
MLLSDIILHEMNGHSLAEKLKTIHPQMKCLFMSGYPADVITQQGILKPGMHFLQKPFSKNELVTSLQKL